MTHMTESRLQELEALATTVIPDAPASALLRELIQAVREGMAENEKLRGCIRDAWHCAVTDCEECENHCACFTDPSYPFSDLIAQILADASARREVAEAAAHEAIVAEGSGVGDEF